MAEENNEQQEQQGSEQNQQQSSEQQSVALVNADGTFSENWIPEEHKDFGRLANVKNFGDLVGQYVQQEKIIGSYKSEIGKDHITVPDASSGPEVWAAYHKAGGCPDTPDGYNAVKPDDFPKELYSEDRAAKWLKIMHEEGASKKLVDRLWAEHHADILSAAEGVTNDKETSAEEIKGKVLEEWGNAYEANVHIGNVGAAKAIEGQSEEFKARLLEKINGDADLIKFSYLLGKQFVESDGAPHIKTVQDTPSDITAKIAELRAKPAFMETGHPDHENIMVQLANLHKKNAESKKTA